MTAMNNATDNASELKKVLTVKYNKQRQSKITQVGVAGGLPAGMIPFGVFAHPHFGRGKRGPGNQTEIGT
jgi:hypothetical protein